MMPSSITTTSMAAVIATLKSGIRNGSVWPTPPRAVMRPQNKSAHPRVTAPGEAAVVGQRLGEAHADAGPDGCRQPDDERIPAVPCRERRGEYRRECGHRAIHQSC